MKNIQKLLEKFFTKSNMPNQLGADAIAPLERQFRNSNCQ